MVKNKAKLRRENKKSIEADVDLMKQIEVSEANYKRGKLKEFNYRH